jgi:hypothetical protein
MLEQTFMLKEQSYLKSSNDIGLSSVRYKIGRIKSNTDFDAEQKSVEINAKVYKGKKK